MTIMKKLSLKRTLFWLRLTLIIILGSIKLLAQPGQLLTYLSLTDNNLTSSQLSKKNTYSSPRHISSARYIAISDIPTIQDNGVISLQIPGSSDTFNFAANYSHREVVL